MASAMTTGGMAIGEKLNTSSHFPVRPFDLTENQLTRQESTMLMVAALRNSFSVFQSARFRIGSVSVLRCRPC